MLTDLPTITPTVPKCLARISTFTRKALQTNGPMLCQKAGSLTPRIFQRHFGNSWNTAMCRTSPVFREGCCNVKRMLETGSRLFGLAESKDHREGDQRRV